MKEKEDITKLVKKAIRGNPKAYGELIDLHQDYLYRMAYLYVKNEDTALDIVQDSILKGYETIKNLRQPEYFKTWITRILINICNASLKKSNKLVSFDSVGEIAAGASPLIEEKCDLYEAIDLLTEKYKTVIILKYFNNLKISEIAGMMNIPEGSVKAYLTRAKQELRIYLKEDYVYAR